MLLVADSIGFRDEFAEPAVDRARISRHEFVYVITWRQGLDSGESRIRSTFSQHQVSSQKIIPNHYSSEAHSCWKCNARLAGDNRDWSIALDSSQRVLEDCDRQLGLPANMLSERPG